MATNIQMFTSCYGSRCFACMHGWRNLFQSGGAQVHVEKNYSKFCGLNWQLWRHKHSNMTSLPIYLMKV